MIPYSLSITIGGLRITASKVLQGDTIWAEYAPSGIAVANLTLQSDGNLVLFSTSGGTIWSSGAASSSFTAPFSLVLQVRITHYASLMPVYAW